MSSSWSIFIFSFNLHLSFITAFALLLELIFFLWFFCIYFSLDLDNLSIRLGRAIIFVIFIIFLFLFLNIVIIFITIFFIIFLFNSFILFDRVGSLRVGLVAADLVHQFNNNVEYLLLFGRIRRDIHCLEECRSLDNFGLGVGWN